MTRTAVLLGAGASRDAGMPLTNSLADELVTRMNASANERGLANLLNFVYGAMLAQVTQAGGDPHTAVNVETMFSAIRLLRDRHKHEATPFIQAWNPAVAAFDLAHATSSFATSRRLRDGVSKALGGTFRGDGDALLDAVREVVRDETKTSGDGSGYRQLELRLRELIVEILSDRLDASKVGYLLPLIELAETQPEGVDIVTLNYDLTIETAATLRSVPVNRGIEAWRPGGDLAFEPIAGRINLIKPHGSVDWVIDTFRGEDGGLPQQYTRPRGVDRGQGGPAVVIGDREKLETEGATLALMRGFEYIMRRADRLVIVGYSGADAHVNAVVRDWINADSQRTIAIVDPSWPRLGAERGSFRAELNEYLGSSPDPTKIAARLRAIRRTAADGIQEGLSAMPLLDPERWFGVEPTFAGSNLDLKITNLGHDLGRTAFYPRDLGNGGTAYKWPERISVVHPDAIADQHLVDSISVPGLASGASVAVHMEFATEADARQWFVAITASREIGEVREKFAGGQEGVQHLP